MILEDLRNKEIIEDIRLKMDHLKESELRHNYLPDFLAAGFLLFCFYILFIILVV